MIILSSSNIKVGLRVRCFYYGTPERIDKTATITTAATYGGFNVSWDDGHQGCLYWWMDSNIFYVIEDKKYRKPKKIIPEIPIDTTLPLLMAGHLQDRMRKRNASI